MRLTHPGTAALAVLAFMFTLSACTPVKDSADSVPADFTTYDAAAFFDTTSYSMASSSGYAFSPDGSKVLVASDETGIFNLYAVDIATGEKTALTSSSDSSFADSYFPNDGRVIYIKHFNNIWLQQLLKI